MPRVEAAEQPRDDEAGPRHHQRRPSHPQLRRPEPPLLPHAFHADEDEGGPDGHKSQTNVQKYLNVALFSSTVNSLYLLTYIHIHTLASSAQIY